jgi:4-amino-4-deoxy-L-arabinose transferase-like glycosyltransferase
VRGAAPVTLAIVGVVLALWVTWSPPGANDVDAGEGYYGVQARNVLAAPARALSPSLRPLGPPGDKQPLYPALLALSVRALGPGELALRWPSLAAAALVALGTALLVSRAAGGWAGAAAAALLMTLPWYADASRLAASAIVLTACGVAALAVVTGGPPGALRGLGAGALLGLAFQCKMWIAVLVALPVAAALPWRGVRRAWLGLAVGALGVGALHLVAVALWDRELLTWWLDLYWQRYLWGLRKGELVPAHVRQPAFFYGAMLGHAFALALPLVAVGFETAARRVREPVPRALLVWGCGLLPLSAFAVKNGIYAYPVVPAWMALAALGAHALATGSARPGPLVALFALVGSPWVMARLGATPPQPAVWAVAWIGGAMALMAAQTRWARPVAAGLCGMAIAGGLLRCAQRLPPRYHDPGYREVARALAPWLRDAPPQRISFLAPEAPAFGYYLFRSGSYWGLPVELTPAERLARQAADPALRAFVLDPERRLYGGWPDSATLAWLESATREITADIERAAGRRVAMRVFVREGSAVRDAPARSAPAAERRRAASGAQGSR